MNSSVNLILAVAGTQSVVGALGKVQGALTGVASASALATMAGTGVKSALDLAGHFNDLNARTGQSVRDLVVLDRAYQNSGLSAEYVAQSIGLMQRALSGSNEEGGKTADTFQRLGLNIATLKRLSFHEQLSAVAAAFARIQNPAERTGAAMALFGKSGAQMLQVLGDPAALRIASEESGRFADRLQADAAKFDEIGDRISIVKSRLNEMWLVTAERLIPALETASNLLNGMNLSVVGAVIPETLQVAGAIGGAKLASKVIEKLDSAVLKWALNKQAVGNAFADGVVLPLYSKLSGALTRVLPIGLAAAIATQVSLGLYAGWKEWRDGQVTGSSNSLDAVNRLGNRANEVRSDSDRVSVLNEANELLKKTQTSLDEEKGRWITNTQAISGYETAIRRLVGLTKMLQDGSNEGWSASRIASNLARDKTTETAENFAAGEAKSKDWLAGDKGAGVHDKIDSLKFGLADPSTQLKMAQNRYDLLQKTWEARRDELEATGSIYQIQQLDLETEAARLEIIKQGEAASNRIAENKARKAANELEDAKQGIDQQIAKLDADFTKTDDEKWGARRALLQDSVAAAQRYLTAMQALRDTAATPEAKALGDTNVRAAGADLTKAQSSLVEQGANPTSYADQIVSSTTSAMNQIGSLEQQVGRLWANTSDSMRTSIGTTTGDMLLTTGSASEKLKAMSWSIYSTFVRNAVQMGVDWAWQHMVMANVKSMFEASTTTASAAGATARQTIAAGETAAHAANVGTQVAVHTAGEGAKTGASLFGTIGRKALMLGETIWHGIQIAVRTGAHIAGEILKTTVSIAQWAIRAPIILLETGLHLIQAGIMAMSAMASIPYVGPFLAIAAMGAIVAAGANLMKKGFATGGDTGGSNPTRVAGVVHEEEWVAPAWQRKDPRYAPIINWLETERRRGGRGRGSLPSGYSSGGVVDSVPWNSAAAVGGAYASATSPVMQASTSGIGTALTGSSDAARDPIHIGVQALNTDADHERWASSRRGRRFLLNLLNGSVREV